MEKVKSQQVKDRNKEIVSHLTSLKGSEKFKLGFQELADKFSITTKQVHRIYSKLTSHPPIDKDGNPIDKNHWKVHTKSWWVN